MNYMEQVAKMLGVEIGERFYINDPNDNLWEPEYYFEEDGIHTINSNFVCPSALYSILNGQATIKKKPWKPLPDDRYYCVHQSGAIAYWCNTNTFFDNILIKIGNCYRTAAEAKAHVPKWKAFFESDEQIDVMEMENLNRSRES